MSGSCKDLLPQLQDMEHRYICDALKVQGINESLHAWAQIACQGICYLDERFQLLSDSNMMLLSQHLSSASALHPCLMCIAVL